MNKKPFPKLNLEPIPRKKMLEQVREDRPDEVIPDDIDQALLFCKWVRG